ncbi:seipin-2-like [Phoenix dactylifera]|uniref:Seipin-2-like n=1 Tax=Phoenix dactylifera TaxID=42345 RepID=A0A8B7CHN8_PHODC|nr:seipin-2-like [Phoenix dactylifera]
MDETELDGDSTSYTFFDALDAFPPEETLDPPPAPSLESISNRPGDEITPHSPAAPRRRRPPSRRIAASGPKDSSGSDSLSGITSIRESRSKILLALKDQEAWEKPDDSRSTLPSDQISTARDQRPEISVGSPAASRARVGEPPPVDAGSQPQGILVSLAGFVIKAVFFQLGLLTRSITFPIWLMHCSFLLLTNPFGTLRRARDAIKERVLRVWKDLVEKVSPLVSESLGSQQGAGKLVARLAWGCFWSFYVCLVLSGLLMASFLGGSLFMGRVVEEPLQMMEELNFDYTKPTPDAFVPIGSCNGGLGSGGKTGAWKSGGWRLVPPNHKLRLIISLTLPESDYNRKLGMFQVRAEFLSADGKVMAGSSQPCMLRFKSSHIHLIETFLKSGSLLAGYSSELQILRVKMTGFTEGSEPTVCIRVILEQRAEYRPGAGIPEIYAASLKLESELPLFKRLIWNWRRTVYIWISTGLFIMELLIFLVCCRPIIVPRSRPVRGSQNRM